MVSFIQKISDWKLALVLFLVAFAQFSNTLNHEYVWDDTLVIEQNPRTQQGFAGIPAHFVRKETQYVTDIYGYRPITLTTFSLDVGLFGMNPGAAHGMQVVWFGLLCVVAFFTLRKLASKYKNGKFFAFLTILFFIVHPLHVEVVANLKSRDEILALLFSLAALLSFQKYLESGKPLQVVLSIGLLILGILSRESAFVAWAFIGASLLLYPEVSGKRKLIGFLLPVFLAGITALTFTLTKSSGQVAKENQAVYGFTEPLELGNSLAFASFGDRTATSGWIYTDYLRKFFVPWPLVYHSGYNQIPTIGWNHPLAWLALLIHAGLLFLAFRLRKRLPLLLFFTLFYFLALSPYVHLIPRLIFDTTADRFMFAPSLALCAMAALGVIEAFSIAEKKGASGLQKALKPALGVGAVIFLLTWSGLTYQRNQVWKSNESLFTHDLPYLENCAKAHFYYGSWLLQSAPENLALQRDMAGKVEMHLRKSIDIYSHIYYSHKQLIQLYLRMNNPGKALQVGETMMEKWPDTYDIFGQMAQLYFENGDYSKSDKMVEKLLEKEPRNPDAYFFMAWSRFNQGRKHETILQFQTLLEEFPENSVFYDMLADMNFDIGDYTQTFHLYDQAVAKWPQLEVAYLKAMQRADQLGMPFKVEEYRKLAAKNGISIQ